MSDTLSAEEKLRRIRRQFPLWMGTVIKAIVDRYGDEGRKLVYDALYQHGQAQGQKAYDEKMKQKPEWDVRDIVQEMQTLVTVMGFSPDDVEIAELSPNRAVLRFRRCPYIPLWRTVGAPANICEIWGSWAHGFYRTFNPRFDFIVLASAYRGSECCEEVWELK